MTSNTNAAAPSERTQVRRIAENANYDQATLYAIIDDAYLCHVAFADDKGSHCIPTACWREDNFLYIHAANPSRLAKILMSETPACVAITHLDGLVLARAAFNHSMNYRSAMIYGVFERVDGDHKAAAMAAFMDKIAPGRQQEARPGNRAELAGTTVMRIALTEAACKQRSGGPNDDEEDMAQAVWAGVLPFCRQTLPPVPNELNTQEAPTYVTNWHTAN